jgi:hypothetical protein
VNAVPKIKITTCVGNRETRPVISLLTNLTELPRPVRQFVRSDNNNNLIIIVIIIIIIIIIIITAIEFSLRGSSPLTGTYKTNKNKHNIEKQSGNEADRIYNMKEKMSLFSALLLGLLQQQCRFHPITRMIIIQYCLR